MWKTKLETEATVLLTALTVAVGGLLAQQAPTPKSKRPEAAGGVTAKLADSDTMKKAEAELHRLRELIRPQPGEYAMNIARITWERDPWEAAVKAAKEGKPVIAYGLQNA